MELQIIQQKIFEIRGQKLMLDFDLAELYEVQTRVLNQAVKRNIERFPEDFMFQLTSAEWDNLKSQIVTSSWGGTRKLPFGFTEQGVAMLSSVLRSPRAVQVNIFIMRAFVKLREFLASQDNLAHRVDDLEKKINDLEASNGEQFHQVFEAIRQLVRQENEPRKQIGFKR